MNKRMRDLLAQMKDLQAKADGYLNEGNSEELNKTLAKIQDLQATYNAEKGIFELEKDNVPDDAGEEKPENKSTGFEVIAKILKKQTLSEPENAMITGDTTSGTAYLVPEDVDLKIREARESYQSLKELVTVYPVNTLSGTAVYDSEDTADLIAFDDGGEIGDATEPVFKQGKWNISFFGAIMPISNILKGAEQAGLMAYINRWFVRKAIRTENSAILAAMKKDKEAVNISGLAGLKEQINTGIEDDYLIDGIILTNHTGFQMLDGEVDAAGRPMLNRDPLNPAKLMYMGLPVVKVSDKLLPNEGGKAPIFIGSLKAGISFYDYMSLQFAVSEHMFFSKNQTALRVIEGFTVEQEFADAYIYGLLSADTGKVVKTKATE